MTQPPYPLPELDLSAPLDRHRATVRSEWIDGNGHMNVGYYVVAFDHATDTLCEQIGCSWAYTQAGLGTTFVLEAHVTYDQEVREGAPLRVTTQIVDHDAKRLHLMHRMYHAGEGYLAATNELMLMHIDHATRRAGPWPVWAMARIERMAAAHKALPRPPESGRVIGIRRK